MYQLSIQAKTASRASVFDFQLRRSIGSHLEMHQLINLDTTGLEALEGVHKMLHRRGGKLVLAQVNDQPASLIRCSGFLEIMGAENVFDDLDNALRAPARD